MSERELMITWTGIVTATAVVMGCYTIMSLYSPATPRLTVRETCATYEIARNSNFCIEIARSGRDY